MGGHKGHPYITLPPVPAGVFAGDSWRLEQRSRHCPLKPTPRGIDIRTPTRRGSIEPFKPQWYNSSERLGTRENSKKDVYP